MMGLEDKTKGLYRKLKDAVANHPIISTVILGAAGYYALKNKDKIINGAKGAVDYVEKKVNDYSKSSQAGSSPQTQSSQSAPPAQNNRP